MEGQSFGPPGETGWPTYGRSRLQVPRSQGVAGAGARRLALRRRNRMPWEKGAEGEERIAESLERRVRAEVRFLWDRALPASYANVDLIAVAPAGIWVVDAKNYEGKAEVRRRRGGELWIAGRNRTSMIHGLDKQVRIVRASVEEFAPGVPVCGALCFLDTGLPLLRTAFGALEVSGYPLVWRKQMARKLNANGPLDEAWITYLSRVLATRFPEN